jgi:predicted nucleotidyltransferase component of viral defense system
MLDTTELAEIADRFGVTDDQVVRDHFISHVLRALADMSPDGLVFFGGTALARTHLPDGRLSEDIDLYTPYRTDTAVTLENRLPQLLNREFPRTHWLVPLTSVRATEPALIRAGDGPTLRIQLLSAEDMFAWPAEPRPLDLRYSDTSDAILTVPTLPAFTAMKTSAWVDRHAERDLYDLAALAEIEAITQPAASLVAQATGVRVAPHMFDRLPTSMRWTEQLAHQLKELPDPHHCLRRVRDSYARVLGWQTKDDY